MKILLRVTKCFPVFEVVRLSHSGAMLLPVKLLGDGRRLIAAHWRNFSSERHAWKRKKQEKVEDEVTDTAFNIGKLKLLTP
jgi:hypothetical protein